VPTLITGSGLIGSTIAGQLIASGQDHPILYDVGFPLDNLTDRLPLDAVSLVRGDINDIGDVIAAIGKHHVDRIIHTAGFLDAMVRERPYAGARVNLMGTVSVLEAARLSSVSRVVFCSSSTIYLGARDRPVDGLHTEDFALRAVTQHPPSLYASLKLAGEWLGHRYQNEYGVDFVAVRFGSAFGPWRGTPSGWLSQMLKRLIESAWYGQPCRLSADELTRGRDYVYAPHAASGALRAAFAANPASRVYNISMGELSTGRMIVDAIERVSGHKLALEISEDGAASKYLEELCPMDISRARAELGYQVEYPMERAIGDYLRWLRSQ